MERFDLIASPLHGTNLIEASAGTGKTYTIAALYLRFIVEQGLTPDQILVVTFTEAATKELRGRIRSKLREAVDAFGGGVTGDKFIAQLLEGCTDRSTVLRRLTVAVRGFDESAIFTIHGFCQRTLHESAFESGSLFDTELVTSQDDLVREIVEDFWRSHFYRALPQVVRYALTGGYGPDAFLKLVSGKSMCQPDLRIIPEVTPPSLELLQTRIDSLSLAVRRLDEIWQAGKWEIIGLLRSPELKGNSVYRSLDRKDETGERSERDAKIDELIQEMENYLREKDPAFPIPLSRQFEAFTRHKLDSSTKKNRAAPSHEIFLLCDTIFELAAEVREVMEQYFLHLRLEAFRYVGEELPKRKRQRNIQHFDDLLLRLRQGLEQKGGKELAAAVRAKYRVALIDEFQDTDPVQYAIFKNIFSGQDRSLFLIGDPKQAIYSFRGADIFTYMKAAGNADRVFTLATNWRSERDLVAAVNTLFSVSPRPFVYPEIQFHPVIAAPDKESRPLVVEGLPLEPMQLWFLGSERAGNGEKPINKEDARAHIRRAITAEMSRLLSLSDAGKAKIGESPLREGDFAVLVRTNDEAREVKEALAAANIKSVLYSTESVFDSPEAEELQRVLSAVGEPHREGLVRAALATEMLGVGGKDLAGWLLDESRWEEWILQFRGYYELWRSRGFMTMFRRLLMEQRVRSRLLPLPGGERSLTNILHLSEVLHQESVERKLGIEELLKWLAEQRDPRRRGGEEHQLRLESDENAVKLVTIHKSKGLEYPVVFCPFAWGSSRIPDNSAPLAFHDENNDRRMTLDLGSKERDAHRRAAERELLAENMRLLYVALTRARTCCYLVWGRFSRAETSAPAYLLHYCGDSSSLGDIVGDVAGSCKALDDSDMLRELQTISDGAGGNIRLVELTMADPVLFTPAAAEQKVLECRSFAGTIKRDFKISSFSALTSNRPHGGELPDRDESDRPGADDVEMADNLPAREIQLSIHNFPRGAKAGTLLHDIFEHLDFSETDPGTLLELVSQRLYQYGFDLKWCDVVCAMLRRVLAAPLGTDGDIFSLSDIGNEERLNELEFYFPLEKLTPQRLREVFARHGVGTASGRPYADGHVRAGLKPAPANPAGIHLRDGSSESFPPVAIVPQDDSITWSEWLTSLHFQPVRGFIKGYIDLVFRHRDRFYIVDWKSNHLGETARHYGPEAMAAAMRREYYILQYYIYTVALDRYLSLRMEGYDYDRHFGGVYYVFLRGVDPDAGHQYGVFHDRPGREAIRALSSALGGGRQ
jgi:exodeoxyribonuclease V beta subunit